MNGTYDGSSFAGELLEKGNALEAGGRIQAGGRLVEEHDWRIVHLKIKTNYLKQKIEKRLAQYHVYTSSGWL
jgi:hypothetical protein